MSAEVKLLKEANFCLLVLFIRVYSSDKSKMNILSIYKGLMDNKTDFTISIRRKLERKYEINITEEHWVNIW